MFVGYTEVYVLQKIICAPHEEKFLTTEERKISHHATSMYPWYKPTMSNCNCVDDK